MSDNGRVPIARSVLVVDDDLSAGQVKTWFREDRTRPDGEQFTLYHVCTTEYELRDELAQAQDGLPDLILLDDKLQSAAGVSGERKAIDMVRWITAEFGDRRPRCILTTGSPTPTFCHAFCELGGHHVIDKHRPRDRMRIMWDTLDGETWEFAAESAAKLTIFDTNALILPYMQHPGWKQSAQQELNLTDVTVAQRKSRLAGQLGIPGDSDRSEFVEVAHRRGLVWVPLIYRHLLPADHREHRAERFVPSRPSDD